MMDNFYHVDPSQLTHPTNVAITDDDECQDLETEARLQLERLDEEMERIRIEKAKVHDILLSIEQDRERKRKRKEEEESAEREEAKRKADEEAAILQAKKENWSKILSRKKDSREETASKSCYLTVTT